MKRIYIISLLAVSITLTGCSALLSKFNSSSVKMENKGDEVEASTWLEQVNKAYKGSSFDTSETVKSYALTLKMNNESKDVETRNGKKFTETKTSKSSGSFAYDSSVKELSLSGTDETKYVEESPYGSDTTKTSRKTDTYYKEKKDSLYVYNNIQKTYYYSSTEDVDLVYYAKNYLEYGYFPFALAMSAAEYSTDEKMRFYQNGYIFTVEESSDETTDVYGYDGTTVIGHRTTTETTTIQANLNAGKYACRYVQEEKEVVEYTVDDENYGIVKGDKTTEESKLTWEAKYNFETINVKVPDTTKYNKE